MAGCISRFERIMRSGWYDHQIRPLYFAAVAIAGFGVLGFLGAGRIEKDVQRFNQSVDANHDGIISEEERRKAYELIGAVPPVYTTQTLWREMSDEQRNQYINHLSERGTQ